MKMAKECNCTPITTRRSGHWILPVRQCLQKTQLTPPSALATPRPHTEVFQKASTKVKTHDKSTYQNVERVSADSYIRRPGFRNTDLQLEIN